MLNDAFWGISAGLKPIPGFDTPRAESLTREPAPKADRKALYAAAGGMAPTHSFTDSTGRYEGVLMDTVEGRLFVGFLTGGRWAVPHDTPMIQRAECLAVVA